MTVGGVDTYYDYKEQRWMHRRLGGGPVRPESPAPDQREDGASGKEPAAGPPESADAGVSS
ncbi:hypothetical protein [Kribbella endophytica]